MSYRKIHKDNEVDIKKGNIFVMKTCDTHWKRHRLHSYAAIWEGQKLVLCIPVGLWTAVRGNGPLWGQTRMEKVSAPALLLPPAQALSLP